MKALNNADTDVIIIGAGPAGLCFARALSGIGLRIALIEQLKDEQLSTPTFDGREIAHTQYSVKLLKDLDIWNRINTHAPSALRDAKVLNGSHPFAMTISHRLSGQSELGWLVSNYLIRKAAYESVQAANKAHQDIQLYCGEKVNAVHTDDAGAQVTLGNGIVIKGQLIVAADSRFSETRRAMGIGADMNDFGKTILVCRMTHEVAHQQTAWEWFGYGQTLALLPMNADPATHEHCSSVVVTLPHAEITPLMQMSPDTFGLEIQKRFANRLGKMTLISTRHSYPLVGVYPHRLIAKRFAVVGDAAVGMHPMTAHGFNFGLLGVDNLSNAIRAAHVQGGDIASPHLLAQFEKTHRRATRPLYLATQLISNLYTNDSTPARFLRDAALRVGEVFIPFKRAVAASLSGTK